MHVDIRVDLTARPHGAVALGVGHGNAEREVFVLHAVEVGEQPLVIVGAVPIIGTPGRLEQSIERVVREIALRAAGLATHQAHRFQLVQQVGARLVDVRKRFTVLPVVPWRAVISSAVLIPAGEVVGDPDRREARRECRLVRHAVDRSAIDEHARSVAPKRLPVVCGGHQHVILPRDAFFEFGVTIGIL